MYVVSYHLQLLYVTGFEKTWLPCIQQHDTILTIIQYINIYKVLKVALQAALMSIILFWFAVVSEACQTSIYMHA